MPRKPRPIATVVENVREQVQEAVTFNPYLFKEIEDSYDKVLPPTQEAALAEEGLYGLWREYLLAYRKHNPASSSAVDRRITETFNDFGDIDQSFEDWWHKSGRNLFMERGPLPLITLQDIDEKWEDGYPEYITLRIPLTISRAEIGEQLDQIFDKCHMGPQLHRHRHSTAKYKIFPRFKYVCENYARMLKVWKLVMEHKKGDVAVQEKTWWEIGWQAGLAPGLDPFNERNYGRSIEEARRYLSKQAKSLFETADEIMQNAVRGEFPKDKSRDTTPSKQNRVRAKELEISEVEESNEKEGQKTLF
jgi:hypothetical protein